MSLSFSETRRKAIGQATSCPAAEYASGYEEEIKALQVGILQIHHSEGSFCETPLMKVQSQFWRG